MLIQELEEELYRLEAETFEVEDLAKDEEMASGPPCSTSTSSTTSCSCSCSSTCSSSCSATSSVF